MYGLSRSIRGLTDIITDQRVLAHDHTAGAGVKDTGFMHSALNSSHRCPCVGLGEVHLIAAGSDWL